MLDLLKRFSEFLKSFLQKTFLEFLKFPMLALDKIIEEVLGIPEELFTRDLLGILEVPKDREVAFKDTFKELSLEKLPKSISRMVSSVCKQSNNVSSSGTNWQLSCAKPKKSSNR